MEKNFKEIQQIQQILITNGYDELATLLNGCWGEISDSGRFGNYNYSTLSTYLIYSQFELMLKQNNLNKDDKNILMKAILMLHPHKANAPEIRSINFVHDEELTDDNCIFISTEKGTEQKKTITFAPSVFNIPDKEVQEDLVSVMMPYAGFEDVYKQIETACKNNGFQCLRAKDIWDNSTIIQDIFDLIFTSKIVIVDFSTKNSNVFYEAGIAHTLGKIVIPIAQSMNDVPFDLTHHRVLEYLNNNEGLSKLCFDLTNKLNKYNPDFQPLPF